MKLIRHCLAASVGLIGMQSASAVECRPVPSELQEAFSVGSIVLFGEVHGTAEMPRRFYDAVCAAMASGLPVRVGLELPHQLNEQRTSEQGLEWQETEFFTRIYQDGRASIDMANLIYVLETEEKGEDSQLELFLFDHRGADRDERMARTVLDYAAPEAVTLVLTGNLHSRTADGAPWDENRPNMGAFLKSWRSDTLSVLFSHDGGKAWLCNPDCGVTDLEGGEFEGDFDFRRADDSVFYNFEWRVGPIYPSPPWRMHENPFGG